MADSPAPKLTISSPKSDAELFITAEAKMAEVVAEVKVEGVTPDPTPTTKFRWTAEISFDASTCDHGPKRVIKGDPVKEEVTGGKWTPKFTQVRGGTLKLSVEADVEKQKVSASVSCKIGITNPTKALIEASFPKDELLRKIARHESSLRQADTKAGETTSLYPLWSRDDLGGVGLMQVTYPKPSDDEVWSWKENLAGGKKILAEKRAEAKGYPGKVQVHPEFKKLVDAFNAARKAAKKPELTITVPEFTDEQLQNASLRGYNGNAGKDIFGMPLHEYRIKLDDKGMLVVVEAGTNGTVVWEEVPVADRPEKVGDPNYVKNVLTPGK